MSGYREVYGSEEITCPFCRTLADTGPVGDYEDNWDYEYQCSACGESFVATARLILEFDSQSLEQWLKLRVASYDRGIAKLQKEVPLNEESIALTRKGRDELQARLDKLLARVKVPR